MAQFSAELERYKEAVEIYEDIAKTSVENNLLKYSAKGYLLNAGICRLCSELPRGTGSLMSRLVLFYPQLKVTAHCTANPPLAVEVLSTGY